jgi:hypothetical protein
VCKSGVYAVIVGLAIGFTIPVLWTMLCPKLLHGLPRLFRCHIVPRIGFRVIRCGALFRLDGVWVAIVVTDVRLLRPFFVVGIVLIILDVVPYQPFSIVDG